MDTNDRTSKGAVRARYLQRIDGLGKCLMLWASLYSEFGSSNPWHYTEPNVDHLMLLISDMAALAGQVDAESAPFWKQMELVLSKAR